MRPRPFKGRVALLVACWLWATAAAPAPGGAAAGSVAPPGDLPVGLQLSGTSLGDFVAAAGCCKYLCIAFIGCVCTLTPEQFCADCIVKCGANAVCRVPGCWCLCTPGSGVASVDHAISSNTGG